MRRGARATSNLSGASTASIRFGEVRRIVFGANYLVLGLGDVYLGAPVATPVDPRHRLVTTSTIPRAPGPPKTRWVSAEPYLCVYGMEGPGGYQFVAGRYKCGIPTLSPGPGCCGRSINLDSSR